MTSTAASPADTTPTSNVQLIDTHTHLDSPDFAHDLEHVLQESRSQGVTSWINVGFSPERWSSTVDLANQTRGMYHMLGIHPSEAANWNTETATALRERLTYSGAIALGEIGLDFAYLEPSRDQQVAAFSEQLDLAMDLGLPVVIHLRDAESAMLDVLTARQHLPRLLFHSFDGTSALTDFILSGSSCVGVGGLSTRAKAQPLRDQLERIPLNRMVLETDSPYLIPARQRARRNTPAHVRTVAEFLASLKDIELDEVARTTTENAVQYFGLQTSKPDLNVSSRTKHAFN